VILIIDETSLLLKEMSILASGVVHAFVAVSLGVRHENQFNLIFDFITL